MKLFFCIITCLLSVCCLSQTDSTKKVYAEPQFRGGDKGYVYYMQKYTSYPWDSRVAGKQGDVNVTIFIDREGNVTNVVTKGKVAAFNEEVKRVLDLSPKWKAATINNIPVDTFVTRTVYFSIETQRLKKDAPASAVEILVYTELVPLEDLVKESEEGKLASKKHKEAVDLYNKGTLELQEGKPESALPLFNQAAELGLDNADLHYNRGVAYFQLGNKDAACKDWVEAARRDDKQALDLYLKKCK